jgi:hypothetical protein
LNNSATREVYPAKRVKSRPVKISLPTACDKLIR